MSRVLLLILLFPFMLSSQAKTIDSLKLELKNAKHDTTRCNILSLLAINANDDEWPIYVEQLFKLTQICIKKEKSDSPLKPFYLNHLANALDSKGSIYDNQGDIPKALEYYHESLRIYENLKDKDGIALLLNNIGYIYDNQKEYTKSLDYYFRSLKIREEEADKQGIAIAYNNIGVVYQKQGDNLKAKDFFEKSFKALKNGGYLCINDLEKEDGTFHKKHNNEGVFHCVFTQEELEEIAKKVGFSNFIF